MRQRLSPREEQVIEGWARGMNNPEIAAELGISVHTVKSHADSILLILGASTRAEAVANWLRTAPA